MSKRLMKLVCLVVSMAMLLTLAACGGSKAPAAEDTKVPAADTAKEPEKKEENKEAAAVTYKLRIHYSTDDEKAPTDWAVQEIAKLMPNVKFEIEPQLNDNGDSLKARIATGDLPDFFLISPMHFDAAINSKSIVNLTGALDSTGLGKKYIKSVMDTEVFYKDKQCWAFPINAGGVDLLYYNKEMFEKNGIKVPTNYPELLAAVKGFVAKGITPWPIFAKEAWPIGAYFDAFATKIDPEGMVALSNGTKKASDFRPAIEKMTELIKAGVFQKGATAADYDTARTMFESGKCPMFLNGEWEIAGATEALGDKVDFIDNWPTTDPGHENDNLYAMPGASELGGIAVSAKVKNQEEAVKVAALLAEYISKGNYVKNSRTDCAVPTDGLTPEKSMAPMTKKLLANKGSYIIKSSVAHSLPNPKFGTGFGELLQKMVAGMSAEDFIKACDKLQESSK